MDDNKMDDHKKVALVTGSGRGIGAATARLFAERGYAVCVNYRRNREAAAQTAAAIRAAGGICLVVQADLSREEDVIRLFHTIENEWGSLDVVVNNAGMLRTQSRLDAMTVERVREVFDHNVVSCFLCCREAVKHMSTRHGGKGGSIVNVSSVAARTGSPNEYIDYAAAKGALDTLTRGLALEVASEGIRVNAVRPGLIHTTIHADGGEPERIARLQSRVPLQRGGTPEEVAEAIYWLASDAASYTTGSFIELTGGL